MIITTKSIIQDEGFLTYALGSYKGLGALGYKGMNVEILQSPINKEQLVIIASALGQTIHLLYITDEETTLGELLTITTEVFTDFCVYVVISRQTETFDTIH